MFDASKEIDSLIEEYNESVDTQVAMESYNAIYEELQNRVNSGELTVEEANVLNDMAYDKYVGE